MRRVGEGGFSLLEVMIALAVAAIALTALLSLANRTILAQSEQQNLTRATLLAEQKMTEIETLYRLGRSGELGDRGVFAEPFARFSWKIDFAATILPAVQQVKVTVRWGEQKSIEYVDLTSFVLREGGRRR